MNKEGGSKLDVKYVDYYQGTGTTLKEFNDKVQEVKKKEETKAKKIKHDQLARLFNFFDQVLNDFGVKSSHTGNRRQLVGFLQ